MKKNYSDIFFCQALNSEKSRVGSLQIKISQSKSQYAQSLRNLEDISESIHAKRKNTQSKQEEAKFDSLQYDLSHVHLDNDNDAVSVSSSQDTGRDSALGSAR